MICNLIYTLRSLVKPSNKTDKIDSRENTQFDLKSCSQVEQLANDGDADAQVHVCGCLCVCNCVDT